MAVEEGDHDDEEEEEEEEDMYSEAAGVGWVESPSRAAESEGERSRATFPAQAQGSSCTGRVSWRVDLCGEKHGDNGGGDGETEGVGGDEGMRERRSGGRVEDAKSKATRVDESVDEFVSGEAHAGGKADEWEEELPRSSSPVAYTGELCVGTCARVRARERKGGWGVSEPATSLQHA